MNKKQKILSYFALCIFALTVLSAPWKIVTKDYNGHVLSTTTWYMPVFIVPDVPTRSRMEPTLSWQSLLCTWAALGIAHGGLFFLLRTGKEN